MYIMNNPIFYSSANTRKAINLERGLFKVIH